VARIVVERLVQYLETSGFVVMMKPRWGTTGSGGEAADTVYLRSRRAAVARHEAVHDAPNELQIPGRLAKLPRD
jgi:hypothetical protein